MCTKYLHGMYWVGTYIVYFHGVYKVLTWYVLVLK